MDATELFKLAGYGGTGAAVAASIIVWKFRDTFYTKHEVDRMFSDLTMAIKKRDEEKQNALDNITKRLTNIGDLVQRMAGRMGVVELGTEGQMPLEFDDRRKRPRTHHDG